MAKSTDKVPTVEESEFERQQNQFVNEMTEFTMNTIKNVFNDGIITEVESKQLLTYFANPDQYQSEIAKLAHYYYITNAEVHTMFDLIEALPSLNYKLESFDVNSESEKYTNQVRKALHKIKHKRLTRDLLKQTAAVGTTIGMWIGSKSNPIPFIFDDNGKYVFPQGRNEKDEWICWLDMAWLDEMTEYERQLQINNLSPIITELDYKNYKKDYEKYQYKTLPTDRTFVLRTGTLTRNQSAGTSWVTSGLYDVLHKKKLKDVEQSIANKVINAIAVLKIGSEKYPEYSNMKLNRAVKQKIHQGVKSALDKNHESGVSLVTIPDFASLDFPDIKTDGLGGTKFDHINSDIRSAFSMSGALMNGEGSNYSSAKLNLDTFYKRVAVMLEEVEQEAYQKLFNWILPNKIKDEFYMIYDKKTPLTTKEQMDILDKLHTRGFSAKYLVDTIDGVDWDAYIEQTYYETDELKLHEKLIPPKTSHTMSSVDENGRPSIEQDDVTNENTARSKGNEFRTD